MNRKYESPKADGRRKLGECNFPVHCGLRLLNVWRLTLPGVTFYISFWPDCFSDRYWNNESCSIATMIFWRISVSGRPLFLRDSIKPVVTKTVDAGFFDEAGKNECLRAYDY